MSSSFKIVKTTSLEIRDTSLIADVPICNATFGDFHKICRLCLGNENIKPFFDMTYKQTSLQSIICDCSSLKVNPKDGLPYNLCETCITELIKFYSFKKRCIQVCKDLQDACDNGNVVKEEEKAIETINSLCYGRNQVNLNIKQEEIDFSISNETFRSFHKICRLCSGYEDIKPFINMTYKQASIQSIMYDCLSLKANPEDGLPYNLCKTCITELIEFYRFKNRCIEVSRILQDAYDNRNFKTEEEKAINCECYDINQVNLIIKKEEIEDPLGILEDTNRSNLIIKSEEIVEEVSISNDNIPEGYIVDKTENVISNDKMVQPQEFKPSPYSEISDMYPHTCSICTQSFRVKYHLTRHMFSHSNDRPHKCSICGKFFAHKFHLTKHRCLHTGEKPQKCNVCKKPYRIKHKIKGPTVIHTCGRRHICSVCKKSFAWKHMLDRHMSLHTGERPHTCSVCERSFRQKTRLVEHMLVHTGERPCKCSVCEKSFRQKSTLSQHMLIHTGEKPHVCSICEKAFSKKAALRRHMLTKHRNDTVIIKDKD